MVAGQHPATDRDHWNYSGLHAHSEAGDDVGPVPRGGGLGDVSNWPASHDSRRYKRYMKLGIACLQKVCDMRREINLNIPIANSNKVMQRDVQQSTI